MPSRLLLKNNPKKHRSQVVSKNPFVPEAIAGVLEPHEAPLHAELELGSMPSEHGADSQWRQNGTDLRCITCKSAHGVYVAPELIYSGETNEEGLPILKKRY